MVVVQETEVAAVTEEATELAAVTEEETEVAAVTEEESLILVASQDTEVAAVKEQESLILLKKLLINVKNFSDKSVAEPDMMIKKLMLVDMSRRLIGWMDKVLSSCHNDGEVKIKMSFPRSKKDSTTSNALEVITSGQTRSSACKMLIIPIPVMRALDFDAMAEVSVLDPGDDISAQDTFCEVELTAHAKADVSSNFPEISMEMVQVNAEKALRLQETKSQAYYALSMNSPTIANFRGELKLSTSMYEAQKFTDKIVKEQYRYVKHGDSVRSEAVGYILCTNPTSNMYWTIDSGASNHISGKCKWITNVRPIPKEKKRCFLNAASKEVRLSGIGDIVSKDIRLYNVYLSNDLEDDELYVSIGQLTGEGYTVLIDRGEVTIRLAKNFNHIVGTGSMDKNAKAYKLNFFNGSVLERGEGNLDEEQGQKYNLAEGEWVLDSGCHNHITCRRSFLNKNWKMRRGKKFRVAGSEQVLACKVKGNITQGEIRLKDAYLCQTSNSNIISVCQLDALGYNFWCLKDQCQIRYKQEKNLVGLAHADGNLNYYVEFLHSKE